MDEERRHSRDWFRWIVSLCLIGLTALAAYNIVELRKVREELRRLGAPRVVPLADLSKP